MLQKNVVINHKKGRSYEENIFTVTDASVNGASRQLLSAGC